MRAGMGNLLETDSDVASVSDGERERTDGDGMEMGSDPLIIDVNKNANTSVTNDCTQSTHPNATEEHDKTGDCRLDGIGAETNEHLSHSSSQSSLSTVQPSTSSGASSSLSSMNKVSSKIAIGATKQESSPSGGAVPVVVGKSMTVSPRELPPRSQLIQLKPTMGKPKLNSRNSMESLSEGINKQKNPRFIPYEPYRCAVRPMVAQGETTKRHSRNASEASAISSSLEKVIGTLNLNDSLVDDAGASSLSEDFENTHDKSLEGRPMPVNVTTIVDAQYSKQGQVIEKQVHALTLLKERLKISEKDNDDLHRENTRLKKLLVDSLCGDSLHQLRTDIDATGATTATSESVDTLSNEIEVWRSKFLSSCVLVEQLTKENGVLNDAVGTAASIIKDIKLSSSLSSTQFEQVNTWLRVNRATASSPVSNENNNTSKS